MQEYSLPLILLGVCVRLRGVLCAPGAGSGHDTPVCVCFPSLTCSPRPGLFPPHPVPGALQRAWICRDLGPFGPWCRRRAPEESWIWTEPETLDYGWDLLPERARAEPGRSSSLSRSSSSGAGGGGSTRGSSPPPARLFPEDPGGSCWPGRTGSCWSSSREEDEQEQEEREEDEQEQEQRGG